MQELEAVVARVSECAPYLKVQYVTPRGYAIQQFDPDPLKPKGTRLFDEYGRNPNRHAEEVGMCWSRQTYVAFSL